MWRWLLEPMTEPFRTWVPIVLVALLMALSVWVPASLANWDHLKRPHIPHIVHELDDRP